MRYRGSSYYLSRKADPAFQAAVKARNAVAAAIRKGLLTPPALCEECGDPPVKGYSRLDAHHEDYSKPLVVRWLCRSCHKLLHPKEAAAHAV